jgi:hypothetical protein
MSLHSSFELIGVEVSGLHVGGFAASAVGQVALDVGLFFLLAGLGDDSLPCSGGEWVSGRLLTHL